MFLPDYLLKGFDSASTGGRPLVSPAQTILQMPSPLKETTFFSPGFCVHSPARDLSAALFCKKAMGQENIPCF
jgi:hypothetical protein